MPGTKSSGRPGGNPEIWKEAKKRQKGKNPLRISRGLRFSEQMIKAIDSGILDEEWTDIARRAIAEALREKGVNLDA